MNNNIVWYSKNLKLIVMKSENNFDLLLKRIFLKFNKKLYLLHHDSDFGLRKLTYHVESIFP